MAAISFVSNDANAQCARGGGFGGVGFGGSGFSLSIGSGYGGFGPYYGGFNRGISVNTFRPSVYYPRPVGNIYSYNSFYRGYGGGVYRPQIPGPGCRRW